MPLPLPPNLECLKKANIRIQRGNGKIEDGWTAYGYTIRDDGTEMIFCINESTSFTKWCHLDVLLHLNNPQ